MGVCLCIHLFCLMLCVSHSQNSRYDQEGYATNSQSLTEMRSVGSGAPTNWKSLSDVKDENMGHGEKVQCIHIYMSTVHIIII